MRNSFIIFCVMLLSACTNNGLQSRLLMSHENSDLQSLAERYYDFEDASVFAAINKMREAVERSNIKTKEMIIAFEQEQDRKFDNLAERIYKKYSPESLGTKNESVSYQCGGTTLLRGDAPVAYYPDYCYSDPGPAWRKQLDIYNNAKKKYLVPAEEKDARQLELYKNQVYNNALNQLKVELKDVYLLYRRLQFEKDVLSALLLRTITADKELAFTSKEAAEYLQFIYEKNFHKRLADNHILGDVVESVAQKMGYEASFNAQQELNNFRKYFGIQEDGIVTVVKQEE